MTFFKSDQNQMITSNLSKLRKRNGHPKRSKRWWKIMENQDPDSRSRTPKRETGDDSKRLQGWVSSIPKWTNGIWKVTLLCRLLNDLSGKLDRRLPKCRSVPDVFEQELDFFWQKLQDYSERLFRMDPVKYGEKIIELYWRKGVYDTFSTARSLKVTLRTTKARWESHWFIL